MYQARFLMLLYLLRRLAAGVAIFFTVTGLTFLLLNARGAQSIVRSLVGVQANPAVVEARIVALGLDRPLVVQYLEWVRGLFVGDLGQSFISSQQVTAILSTRVPVTLSLILLTIIFLVVFGVFFGVLAASRGGVVDRTVQGVYVFFNAVPGYWLALVLVIVFALNLRLFPATGFIPITDSFSGWLSTILLPSIALALGGIFGIAVWVRSSIIDMRRQSWVRTLRSRGLSQRAIMYRHVLRNAAASTVQYVGLWVIGLLSGTVVVERIFALPGLGMMALGSGHTGDIPVVLGAVTIFALVVVITNVVVDILNGFLNPKARVA